MAGKAPRTNVLADPKLRRELSLFSHVRWEHLAAGVTGGTISTLVLHPLDLIKVRFQVNEGSNIVANAGRPQYSGIMDAFVKIRQTEGLKGLYRGVTPNVWGAGASWGLYFLCYNSFKVHLQGGDETVYLSASKHILAASEAGVLTLFLTNPIWVAKTRMCLQYDAGVTTSPPSETYRNMTDCIRKTYKVDGIRGLYKGFVPGLFGVSHGALQFMAYEEMKKVYNKRRGKPANAKFNSAEYVAFAALSKFFAAAITYPYQVVRARLQDQHCRYRGIWDVLQQTWRFEGMRGYFKGLSPYLLHVTPNICIVFLVYEKVTNLDFFVRPRNSLLMGRETPPATNSYASGPGEEAAGLETQASNDPRKSTRLDKQS